MKFEWPWSKNKFPKFPKWDDRFMPLANYNGECLRGIVHTPEYDERMRALQAEYNRTFDGYNQAVAEAIEKASK